MQPLNEIDSLVPKKLLQTGIYTAAKMVPSGVPVMLRDGSIWLAECVDGFATVELLMEQTDPRFSPSDVSPSIPLPSGMNDPQVDKPVLQTSKSVGKGSDPGVKKTEQVGRAGIKKDAEEQQNQLVNKLQGELGHEVERKLHQQLGNKYVLDKKTFDRAFSDFTRDILANRPTASTTSS